MPAPQLPGKVVLDDAELRTITGCEDPRQIAATLGLHERTYDRLKDGQIEPGKSVWKAFLIRFPTIDPRRVFKYRPPNERS